MSAQAPREVGSTERGAAEGSPLLREGRNAWRVVQADRFSLLVDAQEYYRRVRAALLEARRDVFLLGWDFDLQVELVRGEEARDGVPVRLGAFLNHLVKKRKRLRVHVLAWDFSTLFAFDRQPLMVLHIGLRTHRRVRFEFDAKHPIGASHHQKIVVVDDAVAFVGGMDLTGKRWDTSAHEVDHPLRREPNGEPYRPYHDVQAMVSGEAARALGQIARARWERASRQRLRSIRPADPARTWPADLEPDLKDVQLAIARTRPDFAGETAVHEVEQLYLDSIARTRHTIYIESQYFTSSTVAAALAERLAEPDGPEVVLVLPRTTSGWLEEFTLGSLMHEFLNVLREADSHGRLRAFFPFASRSQDVPVYVHSKIACHDDRMLRVGSSNISNRSMGIDTECDVLVEAQDEEERRKIRWLRDRSVAHFLGVSQEKLSAAVDAEGSLRDAIDRLNGGDRGFTPIEVRESSSVEAMRLADPDGPIEPTRLIDLFMPEMARAGAMQGKGPLAVLTATVIALTALAIVWRWTPLAETVSLEAIDGLQHRLGGGVSVTLAMLGVFALATLLTVPLNLLILATMLVFGGMVGAAYSLLGALAGAFLHFGLGRLVGRSVVARVVGPRVNRLSAKLMSRNATAVAAVRLLPVAPFVVVNLACGAARITPRDYALGTLIGLFPGILGLALFGAQVRRVLHSPGALQITLLVTVAAVVVWLAWLLQRFLRDHELGTGGDVEEG